MAWEWSHTNEAYAAAYENLHCQPREWLNVCLAEWQATKHGTELSGNPQFRTNRYDKCLAWVKTLPANDIVADAVWDYMEELRTCDNGGFNAWACPYGCHTVSFDSEEA